MGRETEGKGEGGSGRKREDRERRGRARLGYLSKGPEFLVTALTMNTTIAAIQHGSAIFLPELVKT